MAVAGPAGGDGMVGLEAVVAAGVEGVGVLPWMEVEVGGEVMRAAAEGG